MLPEFPIFAKKAVFNEEKDGFQGTKRGKK